MESARWFLFPILLALVLGVGCASLEGTSTGETYSDEAEQVRELRVDGNVNNQDQDPADEITIKVSGHDNKRKSYRFAAEFDIRIKDYPRYVGEEPEVVYEDSTHVSPGDFRGGASVHFPYFIDDGQLDEGDYSAVVSVTFDATGHTYEDSTSVYYGG